jgi:hypothetical protein
MTETSKLHESPAVKKEKSALERMETSESIKKEKSVSERMETSESDIDALKDIRNDAEQIREIGQSLTTVSREIVNDLTKVLRLSNRTLQLDDFDSQEIVVHPDGFVLIKDKNGNIKPRTLIDLEPPFFHAILKQLLPKLKVSLDETKQSEEHMLEELSKIREHLT